VDRLQIRGPSLKGHTRIQTLSPVVLPRHRRQRRHPALHNARSLDRHGLRRCVNATWHWLLHRLRLPPLFEGAMRLHLAWRLPRGEWGNDNQVRGWFGFCRDMRAAREMIKMAVRFSMHFRCSSSSSPHSVRRTRLGYFLLDFSARLR
jgi:hypothetical protein